MFKVQIDSSRPLFMEMDIWGNGHTTVTNPLKNGWKLKKASKALPDVYMLGQRGVSGCASIMQHQADQGKSYLDVAMYIETPEEVLSILPLSDRGIDAEYIRVEIVPGWGLSIINNLNKLRRDYGM